VDVDVDVDEDEGLVLEGRVPTPPEEEIDPELEEEIRREIEEIRALELEMGLRGPVEARPHRGDPREAELARPGPGGRVPRGRSLAKPPIQEIFRRGDEVLVQVIKESIGTKGPTLSTYISIPGRYLVLMPGLNRVGVSRKIADEGQRRKLREIMNELNPPKGLGFIVRTAGLDRTKRDLAKDLAYLLRLWKVILRRIKKAKAPAPIYQESDMITRTIRDIFNSEIDTIWIDEPAAFERAQEFLKVVMPRYVARLKFYDDKVPLFHKYGLEGEIAKIQQRNVPLPEGGSIVIDQTEALVAIDVNSGNFRVENDAERTAYEMNLRAAKEIARQLRLRDLGGVIVNDFIDMRDERNRRGVERALRDAVKRDRARTKVLRMSAFGIIEMTRQRIRPSLKRSVYEDCAHCKGAGVVKTVESMSIDVMRLLALASHREEVRRVHLVVCPEVAGYLNNRKRSQVAQIEAESRLAITILAEDGAPAEYLHFDCYDAQNNEIRLLPAPPPPPRRGR
jgi:ribonuclease E